MALIEKERLIKDNNLNFGDVLDAVAANEIVNRQPIIDAVPVVRCKDCVACELVEGGVPYCSNLQMACIGYCAYGERKEDILKLAKDHLDGWPDWKKEIYNNSIAISAHAKKIKFRSDEDGTD